MDLDQFGKKVKNIMDNVRNASKDVVRYINEDTYEILNMTNEFRCMDTLPQIRTSVTHRAMQYHTTINRLLLDQNVYPIELIKKVWEIVVGKIEQDPKPKILKLTNPKEFAWEEGVEPEWDPVDINTITFPSGRTPFVFIHGAQYEELGLIKDDLHAFDFFKLFEKYAAWMFKDERNPPVDIYSVSYDTSIADDKKKVLMDAFASAIGEEATGESPFLFHGVLWDEMVRRAEVTGEYIKPFLEKLSGSGVTDAMAITHSLGCHVLAYAAHQLRTNQSSLVAFQSWFCMAPTLPSNVFTSTGKFRYAPGIASRHEREFGKTIIWHSKFDSILTSLYFLANNGCLAMGQTGAGQSHELSYDLDVTETVDVYHGGAKYFELLNHYVQRILEGLSHPHPAADSFAVSNFAEGEGVES